VLSDFRYVLRQLRRSPGFVVTAVVTLALGIGATTAIFTLVQQVMLQSLAVTRPDQLWLIGDDVRCCNYGGYTQSGVSGHYNEFTIFSWEAYKLFRGNTPAFQDLAALQAGDALLGVRRVGSSAPSDNRNGEFVSGNFFQTLGLSAWRGRLFTDADDQEGAPPAAVMSFHTWEQNYGSDPSVVGATFQINGHPFSVIGITPPGFFGAKVSGWGMPDFWLPVTKSPLFDGVHPRLKQPNTNWLDLIGRVRPGTNPRVLEAELQIELHQWLESHLADMSPQEKAEWQKQTLHLTPGDAGVSDMRQNYGDGLRLLLIASICVLLVACANIANLLLARGLKGRQEISVRVALGAPRGRLIRKVLAESIVLGLIGGAAGVGVAYSGARLILHLAFAGSVIGIGVGWIPVQASPSVPVLLFTLGLSLLTGIIFGVTPAWMTSHAEPVEALRGANRSTSGRRHWAQKALVTGQAAVSLVLLSSAAMLGLSLRNVEHQSFGFDPAGRSLVYVNPMLANYKPEQLPLLFRQIDDRLRAIPGVRAVGSALYAPMSGDNWNTSVRIEGKPEPGPKDDTTAGFTRVTPGFFDTYGIKMLAGRAITDDDKADTRLVAVVNEAFAKKFFGNANPVGQHFGPGLHKYAGTYEIVGVAPDMRYVPWQYRDPVGPMFFVPEAQTAQFGQPTFDSGELWSHYLNNIALWAPGNPPGLQELVRRALAEVDPNLAIYSVSPYLEIIHSHYSQQNMIATLALLFGALGLLLAAVGLYGVTAYGVEQRTGEIGVRMALGADRGRVLGMVLRGAFWQVGVGLTLGVPAAIGAGWAITSQLFRVKPWNPAMLLVAILVLGIAALVAAYIPAQRAANLEPMQALRSE
jgi:putative ABC transport system permease protein